MALDNSKYIIYKTAYKDNYLTIFVFKTKYEGLSYFLRLLDLPIYLLSILLFFLQFRSISLVKKLLRGDFEKIKEISIPDHELELTKNFEEYPTEDIINYLYVNNRKAKNFIKTGNITHTRWFYKYEKHLLNTKLLEKFAEGSKYLSFIGCIPFPCLINFKKQNLSLLTSINFFISVLPEFFTDIIRFISFAFATDKSITFSDKGIRNLRIYKLTKTKEIKPRKKIIVSIYFFREIEHFYEIVKSLPDQYEFHVVSLIRVNGIDTFFLNKGFIIHSEYLRVRKINYLGKLIKTFLHILIHPIYILLKKKKFNGALFYALIYNFFSLRSTVKILCVKEILSKNFQNYQFLSFNTWELPFAFYYSEKLVKTIGRYCLVPGMYTSHYFRPHDYILSINELQFSQFKFINKKSVILLGRNIEKNSKVKNHLDLKFDINSKKYMVWIGGKRCPGMSNEMLFNSLKKTKVISDYFGLKMIIRAHPTITKDDTLRIYGKILEEDFIFDNNSPLEEIAKIPAIFSLTTSTADLTIFRNLNPCICVGLDKVTLYRIAIPYKDVMGNLCNQNESIVVDALKKLDKNVDNFNVYKNNIIKYLNSLSYPNENFNEQLLDVFQD